MMTTRLSVRVNWNYFLIFVLLPFYLQDEHIMNNPCMLTQAELEEYSRLQYIHHQKQSSYAQSEGYHSYVSSTDSTSATPFLDRCVFPVHLSTVVNLRKPDSSSKTNNDGPCCASGSVHPSDPIQRNVIKLPRNNENSAKIPIHRVPQHRPGSPSIDCSYTFFVLMHGPHGARSLNKRKPHRICNSISFDSIHRHLLLT